MLRFKEIKKGWPKMKVSQCQLIYKYLIEKPYYQQSDETFIYEKIYSIDKILLSKVSSSNNIRSPIDRCFRKANVPSDFRFEDKTDNF